MECPQGLLVCVCVFVCVLWSQQNQPAGILSVNVCAHRNACASAPHASRGFPFLACSFSFRSRAPGLHSSALPLLQAQFYHEAKLVRVVWKTLVSVALKKRLLGPRADE